MNELVKRVAYLRGLAEGFKIDPNTNDGKLMLEIIETMVQFADVIAEMGEEQDALREYVEEMDESMLEIEEELFGEESDDDEEDEEGDDDGLIEYDCPHCETTLFFDEESFSMEDEHTCPNCGKRIFSEQDDPNS